MRRAVGRTKGGVNFGEAEVENFGGTAVGDKDVGRLDVAMDDAFGMGGVEGIGNFDGNGKMGGEIEGALRDAVLEGHAVEIFHDQESFASIFANIVDGADIRMIESGGGFGFTAKAFEGLAILSYIERKKFEGDKTIEARVFGFVDDAHATATKFFQDAVVGNRLAEKGVRIWHAGAILDGGREASQ